MVTFLAILQLFFSLGFSFLRSMCLLLVYIYLMSCFKMEWCTIDLIYTRSYFERVLSSSTKRVKTND